MPRLARIVEGGGYYHVSNRGNGRLRIFPKPEDFDDFLLLLTLAQTRAAAVDVLGVCLMPDHWHLVLRPRKDGDLAAFMRWLGTAHVRRHHARYRASSGHLYQGRYKSFPIQNDRHLLTVLRYVEANPLRFGLAKRAGQWAWCSDALRRTPLGKELLGAWPLDRPRNWSKLLEQPLEEQELQRIRISVIRGRPYGSDAWVRAAAERLDLGHTLRPRGRPKKDVGK